MGMDLGSGACHPLSAEDVFSHRKWPPELADNDTPVSFIFGGANLRRLYSRMCDYLTGEKFVHVGG